jgi:hypothetical protein
MAGTALVVHSGENSHEQIAYKLLLTIAENEKKPLHSAAAGGATADRKWLLDTYAECLLTVRNPSGRQHKKERSPRRVAPRPHNWQFGTALQLFHFGNERYPNGS